MGDGAVELLAVMVVHGGVKTTIGRASSGYDGSNVSWRCRGKGIYDFWQWSKPGRGKEGQLSKAAMHRHSLKQH